MPEKLSELCWRSGQVRDKDRRAWWDRCRQWKARYPVLAAGYWNEAVGVSNYVLVEVLSECLGDGDILVPGSSGASSEVTMQAFRVKAGLRILNSQGLGPMGFALSAAIGACLASGRRHTVCIEGDGGLQMNSQELETVRRLDLPVKLFVLDNQGYASIRSTQRSYFEGRLVASSVDSGLTLPNTLKLAAAYGLPATEICSHANLCRGRSRAGAQRADRLQRADLAQSGDCSAGDVGKTAGRHDGFSPHGGPLAAAGS